MKQKIEEGRNEAWKCVKEKSQGLKVKGKER